MRWRFRCALCSPAGRATGRHLLGLPDFAAAYHLNVGRIGSLVFQVPYCKEGGRDGVLFDDPHGLQPGAVLGEMLTGGGTGNMFYMRAYANGWATILAIDGQPLTASFQ